MKWIPNALTWLRILLIPLFAWLVWGAGRIWLSLLVFCLAALTDFLDGYLARKWNVISDFGKIADPLADKLLVLTALAALTWSGPFRLWPVIFALIAARELLITILREIYKRKGLIIPADKLGKVKTVMQMTGIIFCLALWAHYQTSLPEGYRLAAQIWFLAVTFITLLSGANYLAPKTTRLQ